MFWNQTEAMIVQYCECTKCQGTVRFKMVNFTFCEFYLKEIMGQNDGSHKVCYFKTSKDHCPGVIKTLLFSTFLDLSFKGNSTHCCM